MNLPKGSFGAFFIFILFLTGSLMAHTPGDNRENAVRFIKIFDNGNVNELDDFVSKDFIDHQQDPSTAGKSGLEALKETFSQMHRIFPDMKTVIHSLGTAGDTVFVFSSSTGTPNEPFMGLPANQSHSITGVDVLLFKDNKVVEHWGFIDPMEIMKMMQSGNNETGQEEE